MKKTFYVTTPIYYVNDIPHIGHTCTTVAADIIARYQRLIGKQVFSLTGTDEHGAKVAEAAAEERLSPQKFCDKVSRRFEEAWEKLNISHDFFIRTTDPRHEKIVADLLLKIYKNGDIYKGKYEGLYCVGCEKFLTESDLVDNKCPLHPNRKPSKESEENYFFRLSKYIPQITRLVESGQTNYIFPEGKRKEIIAKLKAGVNDVSISREKVKWGIPAPWDKKHTIYVWIEALINYYSATRFLKDRGKFWPADIHLIGKEILWFHTVIWQAMLLSAGIPLPKKVFAHSFYTINGQKMSKSLGNAISPNNLVKKFGADAARWLIADSFPSEDDADVGLAKFQERYNADLANGLGNLIARVAALAEKTNFRYQKARGFNPLALVKNELFGELLENCHLARATDLIRKSIAELNQEINDKALWHLEEKRLTKELTKIIASIIQITHLLEPIMPETSKKIRAQFDKKIKKEKPLFPRLNEEKC